jgi:hypothetical protein
VPAFLRGDATAMTVVVQEFDPEQIFERDRVLCGAFLADFKPSKEWVLYVTVDDDRIKPKPMDMLLYDYEVHSALHNEGRKSHRLVCSRDGCMVMQTPKNILERCLQCKAVYYCCKVCQVADWKAGHKAVCKASAAHDAAEETP